MVGILSRRFGSPALGDIIRAPRICIIDALTYATEQRSATRREIRRVLLVCRARHHPVIHREQKVTRAIPSSLASSRTAPQAPRIHSTTKTLNLERRTRASPRAQLSTHVIHRCRSSQKQAFDTTESSLLYMVHDSSVLYMFLKYCIFGIPHFSARM